MNGWGQPMEVPPEPPQVRVNGWMIRLNTFRRAVETCRADVLPYTWVDSETNCFTVPPPEALSAARVVVTTCAACPLLQRLAVLPGHFSLIIIDEAAQALEPEVLLTLALAGPKTRSMMAGDWRQLGPVVRSPAADSLGLGKSLMERLSHTAQYKKNAALLVKLKHNYRSHPGLLTLPSSLFYQDQLVASANPIVTHSLLPAAGFLAGFGASNSNFSDADGDVEPVATDTPLLFYGVQGRELSEDDTPSFFNRVEAVVVCSLIQLLIKSHLKVSPSQIGVIAPYRKQVQKVRLLLREYDLDSVRVGTVDDYQGQEEKVVLLSTTLSNTERLASDQDSSVGFLNNPRRFNVALTRAKALCIVVGNPLVMLARPHWRALLHHCLRTRSYAGCPPPPECGVEGEELGEDAFLRIMEERLLGAGDEPASGEKVLERSFRDEQEFRVII
ncbi:AAA domain-containing protein [Baffinella frigidus]|nr:AAA domain-containing protein [Cryptophyta sp. CCMP2293]